MQSFTKKNRRRRPRIIILAICLFIMLTGGVLFVLEKSRLTDFIKDPFYTSSGTDSLTKPPSPQEQKVAAEQKKQYLDGKGNTENENAKPPDVPTEADTINLSTTQANGSVTVHTKLNGQGYSSGSCKLTAKSASLAVEQTADIIYQPEYSMCAGFEVPVTSLGKGTWTIVLEVTPYNGSPIKKSITSQVQ